MENYNLAIIKPNKSVYSETFIQAQIDRLSGNKKVLYGGAFPVYDHKDQYIIRSKIGLLSYLVQKRIFKKLKIEVREKALTAYLKEENIEAVLAEYGFAGAMTALSCKAAGVPLIIHFHGADAHHRETVLKYKSFYKEAFNYASTVVVVSQDMAEAVKLLGADPAKIELLPYGVDLKLFSPLELNVTKPNFLCVGRFVEKKSPESVIKAFKQVADVYPEAKLWMAGQGPLFEPAVKLVQSLNLSNKVIFTGVVNQEDIYQLMRQVCCYVQHSVTAKSGDMEGTPNAVIEASAVGLPVVSTRHAGIKQAVIHGKTGFLTEEHDVDAMAAYMLKVVSDPALAAALGRNGIAHIQANYNMNTNIAKLDNIIKRSITSK